MSVRACLFSALSITGCKKNIVPQIWSVKCNILYLDAAACKCKLSCKTLVINV